MGLKAFFLVMAVVITISVIILAGMTTNYNKTQANIDQKLVAVDADIAHLIDVCQQTTDSATVAQCDISIIQTHDNECKTYQDRLSVCKPGGPVDTYIKNSGY